MSEIKKDMFEIFSCLYACEFASLQRYSCRIVINAISYFAGSNTTNKKSKATEKETKRLENAKQKQELRMQKKIEAEKEKALKKALSDANKNLKPEECMKVSYSFNSNYIF